MGDAKNTNAIIVNLILYKRSNLNLLKDDYSRPPHTNDVSVVYAQGSQERKKAIPAIVTGILYTEKFVFLGIIMLQKMKQFFSLFNLVSF
jgi:hypothetical protein